MLAIGECAHFRRLAGSLLEVMYGATQIKDRIEEQNRLTRVTGKFICGELHNINDLTQQNITHLHDRAAGDP